jgi:DNA repair protein RecO (recombination protein O)
LPSFFVPGALARLPVNGKTITLNPARGQHHGRRHLEKDNAILIRRSRLTETSLIVHWCSARHGIMKTVAKGALRPKSKFHGRLDLFFDAEIELVRSRRSDLHILRELAVTNPRVGIRSTYSRTLAASYFVQLLETVCERETPIDDLYDLLRRAVDFLDTTDPDRKAVLHFEHELTRLLGLERPTIAPIESIRELFHRVPPSRQDLLDALGP